MAKFKIGDKVRLKKGLEVGKRYGGMTFLDTMVKGFEKAGGVGKVRRVIGGFEECLYALGNEIPHYYTEEMLEAVEEKEKRT